MAVRSARIEDAERLCLIHLRAVRESCSKHYSPAQIALWTRNKSAARFQSLLLDPSLALYVGLFGEATVGFGMLNRETGRILMLYVLPEFSGHGVGRALLWVMERALREAGFPTAFLTASLNAREFYENLGYRNLGSFQTLEALPGLCMEKSLLRYPLRQSLQPV